MIESQQEDNMITRNCLYVMLLCLILCSSGVLFAQRPADAVAEVPELEEFHEVIFKIWHEAWPEKNISLLQELLPEVEEGISSVVNARLPGILREKKEAWDKGIEELRNAGDVYKAASAAGDDTSLLKAAEELHYRFEVLMRLIRPVLKELEDFHSSLYMLYHYYLPEFDLENIRASAVQLQQKMEVLKRAVLPEWLEENKLEFQNARNTLSKAVESFNTNLDTDSDEAIEKAIHEVHENYRAVQNIFE